MWNNVGELINFPESVHMDQNISVVRPLILSFSSRKVFAVNFQFNWENIYMVIRWQTL